MTENTDNQELLAWTTGIVASHVRKARMPVDEVSNLIRTVHGTLANLSAGKQAEAAGRPEPAVPIRRSVTAEYIVCLEDGRKLKMLKRHLNTAYNMTPEQYRERWNLPSDYPMVAPNYARQRSELAKQIGLGRRPRSG